MGSFFTWPMVLGHSQGFVYKTPSWWTRLSNGNVVEVWPHQDGGYTACLYPSTRIVGNLGQDLDHLDHVNQFWDPADLAETGWFLV